jgi:predicted GNAT superfamily acetyltransferase
MSNGANRCLASDRNLALWGKIIERDETNKTMKRLEAKTERKALYNEQRTHTNTVSCVLLASFT